MGLGVLCPGQGSQNPAMMDILAGHGPAERVLAEAGSVLGRDLRELAKSAAEIYRNQFAQPLLCATEMATWAAMEARLPVPLAFAGYSVGELAAYGCAGSLSASALVGLARERALLMDRASERPGAMLAVRGLPRPQVEELCRHSGAEIAIINGYDRFVIGATADGIAEFRAASEQRGALVSPLPVEVAAHTSQMAAAGAAFRALLNQSDMGDPVVPVMSGIHGLPVHRRDEAIRTLADQVSTTIDWSACLQTLTELGCTVLLELGPGNALSRMVRESRPELAARSVADFRALVGAADWVRKSLRRAAGD